MSKNVFLLKSKVLQMDSYSEFIFPQDIYFIICVSVHLVYRFATLLYWVSLRYGRHCWFVGMNDSWRQIFILSTYKISEDKGIPVYFSLNSENHILQCKWHQKSKCRDVSGINFLLNGTPVCPHITNIRFIRIDTNTKHLLGKIVNILKNTWK